MGRSRGGTGGLDPPENPKLIYASLEKLVRTRLTKQLDPLGPVASQGRSVRPSVKYVDDLTFFRVPMTEFSESMHVTCRK